MEADDRYLSLEEMQRVELDMLVLFDGFCRQHDLRYSLVYGTLLGAVRHHGFIPWDDDVDVMMPRPDYERLIGLADAFEEATRCNLTKWSGSSLAESPFVKMCNPEYEAQPIGDYEGTKLWLDVFPMDVFKDEASAHLMVKQNHKWLALIYAIKKKPSSTRKGWRQIAMPVIRSLLVSTPFEDYASSHITERSKSLEFENGEICAAASFSGGTWFEKAAWDDLVEIEFEGHAFKCIPCWDAVLTRQYGDYMVLPDESKRITHKLLVWESEQ